MAKIDLPKQDIFKGMWQYLEDYLHTQINNSEGDLIVNNNILYKILFDNARKKEKIMLFFDQKKDEFPIALLDLLYEDKNFYAYSMELLKDYDTLYVALQFTKDFKTRQEIALRLIAIAKTLKKYRLTFFDWHSKNFMLKDNIKFIDIDSTIQTRNEKYIARANFYLLQLCLSLSIGKDLDFDTPDLQEYEKVNFLTKCFKSEAISLSLDIPLELDFIESLIKNYTKEMSEEHANLILTKNPLS